MNSPPRNSQQIYDRFSQLEKELARRGGISAQSDNLPFYPHLPLRKPLLVDLIERLQQHYQPTKGRMLDLGSGTGKTLAVVASSLGIDGYGVEIRPYEVELGNRVLEKMAGEGYFGEHQCRIQQGNLFPADFPVDTGVRGRDDFFGLQGDDVYAAIGPLRDFDLIYVYQYDTNIPDILRLVD